MTIIVLGYIVRGPTGGLVWHHLQFVAGLVELGHNVYFIEDSDDYPSCYDPVRHTTSTDPSYGLEFIGRTFDKFGLAGRWAYHDAHAMRWLGPCADRIILICAAADLVLNLSGMNPLRPWLRDVPARVLVDTDPVFTQIRHLTDPPWRRRALEHTAFFTFGTNIPGGNHAVPDDGLPWQATRQPVLLSAWAVTAPPMRGRFTTVMQWDSYLARDYNGRRFGMKSESFTPYLDLPERTGAELELAVGGATAPRQMLERKGWTLRDPQEVARNPWTYRRYLQRSKAEFSVAKHGYVAARSGWFSERSACYLASGRPVLVQETGFSDWLKTESGVVPFCTPEQALAGIDDINARYAFHCRAAREIAHEYFDSGRVLSCLLDRALRPTHNPTAESGGNCRGHRDELPTHTGG